jgi:hypothetical protein
MAAMMCPKMIVDADQFVLAVTVGSGIARPANLTGREQDILYILYVLYVLSVLYIFYFIYFFTSVVKIKFS